MQADAAVSPSAAAALCDPWSAWRRARLLQLQSLSADGLRSLLLREEERWLRLQSPVPPVDPMEDDDAAAASLAAFAAAFAPASAPAAASSGVAAAPTAAPAPALVKTHTRADDAANLTVETSRTHAHTMQSDTHVSPAMRIYRHALESILAMLQLRDLTQILGVSREWSSAVRSMKPLGATIEGNQWVLQRAGKRFRPLPPIRSLVTGPLLRHLAAILIQVDDYAQAEREEDYRDARARAPEDALDRADEQDAEDEEPDAEPEEPAESPLFTSESLALLAQHVPNLKALWCHLKRTPPPAPLVWPANLTSLTLELAGEPFADEINRVLSTLTALHSLQRLVFRSPMVVGVDWSLLAASPTLSDLSLGFSFALLSDTQVDQIRSSLGHLQTIDLGYIQPAGLARLLQPPHTARWQEIGHVSADARTGDLLATLPTLTKVHLAYEREVPHADFLSKLPLLSVLKLSCCYPTAPLLAAMLTCAGLTELDLQCEFSSPQVGTLLAALTKLRKLKLLSRLETLQCLASGLATRTLESLSLYQSVALSEVVHLYALQGLRSLELLNVVQLLDEAALASLTPPTAHLPRLTRFVHTADWKEVERAGPSFEWMQKRLTQ